MDKSLSSRSLCQPGGHQLRDSGSGPIPVIAGVSAHLKVPECGQEEGAPEEAGLAGEGSGGDTTSLTSVPPVPKAQSGIL